MSFEQNIFINCPFDTTYRPILKTLVFGAVYLGYKPLLSETINSADSRIERILSLLSQAKYSIHDLSRMQLTKKKQLARFNMPFELGMDVGCKRFGDANMQTKCFLILDTERFRYQRAISDIAGRDIETHNDQPEIALMKFRNWIRKVEDRQIDTSNTIWRLYNEFIGDMNQLIANEVFTQKEIDAMPWSEYGYLIKEWLEGHKNRRKTK